MSQELDLANLRKLTEAGTPLARSTVLALLDRLEASEAETSKYRGLYDEAESAHTDAEAKLARVSGVHTPTNALMNPGRHERVVEVCTGCGTDDGNWQIFPCPTIRALGGAS